MIVEINFSPKTLQKLDLDLKLSIHYCWSLFYQSGHCLIVLGKMPHKRIMVSFLFLHVSAILLH